MSRLRIALHILLIAACVLMPMAVSAQEEGAPETDCGFLGIQCGFIPEMLSLIRDLIQGFFDFVFAAINAGLDIVRGIADFIVTAVRNILQLLINLIQPLIDLIAAVIRAIVEVGQIIILVMQIIFGFFIAVVSFTFQALAVIIGLFTDYNTAPVLAIPGLPQCVTAPTDSDICALYYALDWTLFAPDTPGALIVPLVTILLDVTILFFFVRRVLSMVSSGEKVTDV